MIDLSIESIDNDEHLVDDQPQEFSILELRCQQIPNVCFIIEGLKKVADWNELKGLTMGLNP